MRVHNYLHPDGGVIKIRSYRRPSEKSARGIWVVREFTDGKWQMPCCPEITWGTLKKLIYLGSTKEEVNGTESN
jgi:hypothetical protein